MIDALRFEWVRIRTLRSTYWLIATAMALNALTAFLVAFATRRDPLSVDIVGGVLTGGGSLLPLPMAAVCLSVVGILATGHEYRYGTIQPTLITLPRRIRLLAAKISVVGTVAVTVAVASMLVNLAAGLVFWGKVPNLTEGPLASALPGYVLLVLLWAVLGVALAQIFRGVPSALVVILLTPLIVEQVILRLSLVPVFDWLAPVVKFLPFSAGQWLIDLTNTAGLTSADNFELFDRWLAGGVFALFVLTMLVIAGALLRRRDA